MLVRMLRRRVEGSAVVFQARGLLPVVALWCFGSLASGGCGGSHADSNSNNQDSGTGLPIGDAGATSDAARVYDSGEVTDADKHNDAAIHPDGSVDVDGGGDAGRSDAGNTTDGGPAVIPLPSQMCTTDGECGTAGECLRDQCGCRETYRACPGGCCPIALDTTTRSGVVGDEVRMAVGRDDTVYVLARQQVSSGPATYELRLFTQAPGGAITQTNFAAPVSYDERTFDLGVRSDGVVFIAATAEHSEGVNVVLHQWQSGQTDPVSEIIGTGFGFDLGLGATIDLDGRLVATWRESRSGGLRVYTLTSDGLERTFSESTPVGPPDTTDPEVSPATGDVHVFVSNRFGGSLDSGMVELDSATPLGSECPAGDGELASNGDVWSIYETYPSLRTSFCHNGTSLETDEIRVRGDLDSNVGSPRMALDENDVAFVAFYNRDDYAAEVLSSVDGVVWSRAELPIRYGNPNGENSAGRAFMDVAGSPLGGVVFVVVPEDTSIGDMMIARLR